MRKRNEKKEGGDCNHPDIYLGLIGRSLSHSFSKSYFEERYHIPYRLIEIERIEEVHEVVERFGLDGFNVTIPYKREIISLLNRLDPVAREIGAVNTVVVNGNDPSTGSGQENEDEKGSRRQDACVPGREQVLARRDDCVPQQGQGRVLWGFNTDAPAFLETLKPLLAPHHQKALILGSGGASRAVAWALRQLDIEYRVVSRETQLRDAVAYSGEIISYDEAYTLVEKEDYNIIVNATPVGMFPRCDETPWRWPELLDERHLCYDLIYNPSPTLFLQQAAERGTKTIGGLAMLHRQADLALEIWRKETQ